MEGEGNEIDVAAWESKDRGREPGPSGPVITLVALQGLPKVMVAVAVMMT